MHPHTLRYSLDPKLSVKDLKKWKKPSQTKQEHTKKLCERVDHHQITAMVDGHDLHFKFWTIVQRPYIVYYMWNISLLDQDLIGIVWPRKPSVYMQELLNDLFDDLPRYHLWTISWGADGIDSLVHTTSIKHNIPTVMVLWSWFVHALWSTKRSLIQDVLDNDGLILSEFRLKQQPTRRTFPQRNRIVAWLSTSLFTPWAWVKSWTLITVDYALQMNKPVYSPLASMYDTDSAWSNEYICKKKVTGCVQFWSMLNQYYSKHNTSSWGDKQLPQDQQQVIKTLSWSWWLTVHELSLSSWFAIEQLHVVLLELEMNWLIWQDHRSCRHAKS